MTHNNDDNNSDENVYNNTDIKAMKQSEMFPLMNKKNLHKSSYKSSQKSRNIIKNNEHNSKDKCNNQVLIAKQISFKRNQNVKYNGSHSHHKNKSNNNTLSNNPNINTKMKNKGCYK